VLAVDYLAVDNNVLADDYLAVDNKVLSTPDTVDNAVDNVYTPNEPKEAVAMTEADVIQIINNVLAGPPPAHWATGGKNALPLSPVEDTGPTAPAHFEGWLVNRSGGYYKLFKRVEGKLVALYIGKRWRESKARIKIAEFEGRG
jgi:hypothetical protein